MTDMRPMHINLPDGERLEMWSFNDPHSASSDDLTTWKELIEEEMNEHDETWADTVSTTIAEGDLLVRFDNGYGGIKGREFTLWTTNRVYFPADYDGAEWCASVSRNPDGKSTSHIGGGG